MGKADKIILTAAALALLLLPALPPLMNRDAPWSEERLPPRAAPPLSSLPLDIGRADAGALCALPGVGPVIAERIVACREARGSFESLEELTLVEGIGDKTMGKIYSFLGLGETASPAPAEAEKSAGIQGESP